MSLVFILAYIAMVYLLCLLVLDSRILKLVKTFSLPQILGCKCNFCEHNKKQRLKTLVMEVQMLTGQLTLG